MQLDFLFDVEAVEREVVPDEPGAVLLHFKSGEFGAEVWTDAAGMADLAQAIIEARPAATTASTSPTGRSSSATRTARCCTWR